MRWLVIVFLMASNYLAQASKNLNNFVRNADLYLDVNGRSKHIGTDIPYNEENTGFGISATQGNDLVKILTAGGYKNSYGEPSYYAGGGLAKRFGNKNYMDVGAVGGVVTGYEDKVSPLAAALLSLGRKDRMRLNFLLAPKFKENPALLMMNLGIPFR